MQQSLPMDKKFNGGGGDWGKLEKTWQDALKANKEVKVSIQPVFTGTSKRPTSFVVEQQINGASLPARRLQNTASGK
ncbi:MAG: ESAT-6 secretion machinery protein EssD [Acinetobacter bereziniae]|uniref:ESAT-6 secretion machinery protein EssD n=1 Tax=Acinetobacter bereziniae TaxID=106648 RepID=A0A833PDI5_ACIBZ|nr:MAG: ESAT-6 secretion machinery protein EssD [Acinetobacter bereziniae]